MIKYHALSLFISHSLQDKSSVGTPAILAHKQQSTHVQETSFNVANQLQTITDLPLQEILCHLQLFSSVRFLARQALPFRAHFEENGNYSQLVALQAERDGSAEVVIKLNHKLHIT